MEVLPVHIAVLAIAEDAATADRATAHAIREKALAAGHDVVDEELAKDNESAIRDQLVRWIADDNIDVVIVAAALDSEAASAALAPLVHSTLPGFTDLFRWLTFQEIGASAMLSAAEAAQCQSTFVFVLPAHEAAVRAAMDKLILPQLDVRTKPKNLVAQMPRLKDAAKKIIDATKSQPVAAPASAPVTAPVIAPTPAPTPIAPAPPVIPAAPPEAVPIPIASEKTQGGSGLPPKLPARAKPATKNTIARKVDDPPTKPIDLAKLEKQIALSNQNDAQTKLVDLGAQTKVVDMSAHQAKTRVVDASRLPRVPPGADESALDDSDDEPLTFRAPGTPSVPHTKPAAGQVPTIAPRAKQPTGQVPTIAPRAKQPTGQVPTIVPKSTSGTSPGTPAPTRAPSTPPFATPISRSTPAAPYRAATPPITSRSTVATPPAVPIVAQRQAPPSGSVAKPAAHADEAPTVAKASAYADEAPTAAKASAYADEAPTKRQEVLTPETPVIALRKDDKKDNALSPETPVIALRPQRARPPTPPPPPPIKRPPTAPPTAADPSTPAPVAEEPPSRPTPQPNAAELWARSIASQPATSEAPGAAETAAAETASAKTAATAGAAAAPAEAAPAETNDEPSSPIAAVLSNQPVRKRPPTPPPVHLANLGQTVGNVDLPHGEFHYPTKRSGTSVVLKILVALAVLAAGFFAFIKFFPMGDDKPTQTAAVTPPATDPPPAAAPVAEAPADAADAEPDIEIDTPDPDDSTTATATPGSTTKPPRTGSTKRPRDTGTSVGESGGPTTKPDKTDKTGKTDKTDKTDATASDTSKPDSAAKSDGDCDEVGCVLSKYDRPCCERYKPADTFTPKNVVPEELDKTMVRTGVEKIKPRVVACGEQSGTKGTVRLAVTVDGAGNVKNVSVSEAPDNALGECVAAAMRNAKFGKSVNGGEFTYPFVF